MGQVTSNPPVGEQEPQWQQPPFQPDNAGSTPEPSPVASGSVILSRKASLPPSVPETVVRTLQGLIWPAFILLVVLGLVGWWPGMFATMVATIILSNVGRHLQQRRRAISRGVVPPDEQNRLR